ncbi:DUF5347 family protein [Xenorhabdus szentirmaii]|uniref:Phage-related protein n=1 Tax=Xenorhabdus szentirmaii DSM 16338 TaxID=1427518 RepID=W1IZH8_9GAMM|nr:MULTISPECIES: DUF5347 family protein [Xenorhabdus]MBD2806434.1 DUF5347 family protein [Xenorhabdus sp. ZM]MBD2825660.1 DUF5347 family protein [Xenorhabdus sp. 5]PHM32056.1 Phage-related protein [Xenorhabdus szentirmaii DSM 16338]CDL83859.1 Phage-related protein [Xenorhabdus szentirmaii DSM 16338]
MANTEPYRAVILTLDEKIDGMLNTAQIKNRVLKQNSDKAIAEFIKNMRDRTNNRSRNNERVLHSILHLAGFPKSKYGTPYESFTYDEKKAFIEAIIQFKAVASLMPESIAF